MNIGNAMMHVEPITEHNVTVRRYFADFYLPYIKSYKKTYRHDRYTYFKQVDPFFGNVKLNGIKAVHVDQWITEQSDQGYKNSTIIKHLVLLKRMMRVAVRWELIPNDNAVNNHRKIRIGDLRQKFLVPEQIKSLIKECYKSKHPFLGYVVELLILTGARCGEIRLAKWCNIDMDESALTVPVSKTGKRRTIYLSERSKKVIALIRKRSQSLGIPVTKDAYLVQNPRTGKPYNDFQVSFSRARAAVGLNDVRVHDLRHTYASLLIQNGISLYEVQKLLGHSSPHMTQRYAHLSPNSLKQIVNDLPRLL